MALYNLTFADLGWRGRIGLLLATAVGLAAAAALIVVSLGLFVIIAPLVIVAAYIGRWRLRKMMEEANRQRPTVPNTIETDYRVIDGDDRKR